MRKLMTQKLTPEQAEILDDGPDPYVVIYELNGGGYVFQTIGASARVAGAPLYGAEGGLRPYDEVQEALDAALDIRSLDDDEDEDTGPGVDAGEFVTDEEIED